MGVTGLHHAAHRLRTRMRVARAGAASLALLAECALVWFTAGIPPAFAGSAVRWLAFGWLCIGIACLFGSRPQREEPETPDGGPLGRRWRLKAPAWLILSSALLWLVLTVAITFVVDSAVPALVLGPDPGRAVATSVIFTEAKARRDVDRTEVRFETDAGIVEAWAADPHHTLREGSSVVYDRGNPQRVMAEVTWAEARSTPWRLPLALLLWLTCFALPFGVIKTREIRYGCLRPGHPIAHVTRPRRAKLLKVKWADGPSATFLDKDGLAEALIRKIEEEGLKGAAVPGHPGRPKRGDGA